MDERGDQAGGTGSSSAKMDVMVGYPDKFRDYSKLEVEARRPVRQRQAQRGASNGNISSSDLDKPVDRKKWAMSPATVERL